MISTTLSAPDLVRPLIGFRQWRMHEGILYSVWTDDPWQGGVLRARCRGSFDCCAGAFGAPGPDCTCGVYAWHNPIPVGASPTPELVAGAAVLWGAIEIHATGMRAQFARIVALALPLTHARKRLKLTSTAGELGVDLVPHRQLLAAATAHGTPVPPTLLPGYQRRGRDSDPRTR